MEAYHLCGTKLSVGSVILPGNWGRIIHKYPFPYIDQTHAINITQEYILEKIRLEYNPDLPSRLKSLFCCPNEESARNFSQLRSSDIIYKVHINDESLPLFYGSWSHVLPIRVVENQMFLIAELEQNAKLYWETDWLTTSPTTAEIITLSPVTITDILS